MTQWFYRRGELAREGWETLVDARTPGWAHTGLRVGALTEGTVLELPPAQVERIVMPLSGPAHVEYVVDGATREQRLGGRPGVFHGPSDVLYLPSGAAATLRWAGSDARISVSEAVTAERRPARYLPHEDIPVELRGAGTSSRQVQNFGTPAALDAAKIIACEVITPADNWSSYPAHKHDEHLPGHESRLEEIYYFEAAVTRGAGSPAGVEAGPGGADPFGMFATYSSPAGEIDINALARTGDVALIPYGYHGPAAAAPGYDLYYLNVMAGPDEERVWLISDDPAHAWVRGSWEQQSVDPRLPYTATGTGASAA